MQQIVIDSDPWAFEAAEELSERVSSILDNGETPATEDLEALAAISVTSGRAHPPSVEIEWHAEEAIVTICGKAEVTVPVRWNGHGLTFSGRETVRDLLADIGVSANDIPISARERIERVLDGVYATLLRERWGVLLCATGQRVYDPLPPEVANEIVGELCDMDFRALGIEPALIAEIIADCKEQD